MKVLPLCAIHHRNGSHNPPISRHPNKKRFEEAYGTEEELLELASCWRKILLVIVYETTICKSKRKEFTEMVCRKTGGVLKLDEEDLESRPMGSQGEDIIMGKQSREVFPYSIECKTKSLKCMESLRTSY